MVPSTRTRKDIVRKVAGNLHIDRRDAKAAVDMTLDAIQEVLCEAGRLELRNFGVFEVKIRRARTARNVRTNTPILLPARKVVTFQPGKMLSQAVAGATPPSAAQAVAVSPGSRPQVGPPARPSAGQPD